MRPAPPSAAPGALPTARDVVSALPWKWHTQGAIFVIGGLGFMFDAWDVALNGFLIPLLSREWGLSVGQAAWIATANLIGMAVGAFVWGGIADRIGRKRAFTLTLLVFSVFTVAGALAPNIWLFCAFRFLAGFGLGGCIPVDYALVGEFTPARHRGRVLTAMDGWWPVGATLCALTSAWLLSIGSWHLLMLVMVLPALLTVAVRALIPESPMYLLSAGRTAEADAVISRLVARTGAQAREWTHEGVEPMPHAAGLRERLRAGTGQVVELWRHSPIITATSWLLFVAVLLVYYAALTWLPKILRAAGLADQAAFLVTGAMTAIGILGVVAAALLVEAVGRKWVLGGSAVAASVCLVWFSLELGAGSAGDVPAPGTASLSMGAKAAILAFGFFIQVAIPALYTYVSELYPTRLRGSGFGWASAASRVATGLAPLVFGSLLWPLLGLPMTFALLGGLVVVAVAAMALCTRETRGEELA
ncbi:MFS transporter [Brevibacterium sp. BRM-1]|uniref:MFS transporter n=1 Tax=Brevibacterium sp. BRM-1 TaxID=2999062 RepID=UPI002282BCC1|nr:MFS transporter [Brevibacterium sp. BRM-1]WAL41381.1 MFS transporter [Brevibacterium sp. BRM-1]